MKTIAHNKISKVQCYGDFKSLCKERHGMRVH